jgi:Chaperonin 10 Kd subunit
VGSGKSNGDGRRAPLDVKAGDTILFGKFAGQEIKLDGVECLILKEEEVLSAIVSPTSSTEVTRSPQDRPWVSSPTRRWLKPC